MPRVGYIQEALRQLENPKYYKVFAKPRHEHNLKGLLKTLNHMEDDQLFDAGQVEALLPGESKPRQFYGLPSRKWCKQTHRFLNRKGA